MVLVQIFLITNDIEHSFMYLLPIYISSFVKYLFKYFASCGKEDVFLLSHKSYLYITDTKPLSCIYVCVCFPYYFLYGVF